MTPELEIGESKYARFRHPRLHTQTLFAWIVVPLGFMETEIPKSAPNSKTRLMVEQEPVTEIDDDGNEYTYTPPPVPATETVTDEETGEEVEVPVYRQLKLREYVPFRVSNDGTQACFRLAAWDAPTFRRKGIQAPGMELWENYLNAYGQPFENAMNVAEHDALMATPEWADPETEAPNEGEQE